MVMMLKAIFKHIRKYMPLFNDNNLVAFVNEVQDKCPKPTSFTAMIIPFVNVLARLETDDGQYQQLFVSKRKRAGKGNARRVRRGRRRVDWQIS